MYLSKYCEIWCLAQVIGAESKNSTFEYRKPILTPIVQIGISSEPIDHFFCNFLHDGREPLGEETEYDLVVIRG